MNRSLSVIVPTYNATRQLECVLAGLSRQSTAPTEILIADDGSTPDTEAGIARWRDLLPAPLHHHWQEDKGFRKGMIVNKAAQHAVGDYLAFLDGDTIPHRHWVKDHLRRSRPSRVLMGRRGRLGPRITPTITPGFVARGALEEWFGPVGRSSRARDSRKLSRSVRLPFLVSWIIGLKSKKLMGCNFSLPREAFVKVNGYDEDFEFYGGEDRDLGVRLANLGMRMTPIINRACVFHMHHEESRLSPEQHAYIAAKCALGRTRAEIGMDARERGEACLLKS